MSSNGEEKDQEREWIEIPRDDELRKTHSKNEQWEDEQDYVRESKWKRGIVVQERERSGSRVRNKIK